MSSAFTNRAISNKTSDSSYPHSKKAQQRSFIAILSRMFNMIYRTSISIFKSFRSFLWIGSTGKIEFLVLIDINLALIFMMIPIGFSILSETELEYQKLERASQSKDIF